MLTTDLRRYFPASSVIGLDIETTGLSITTDAITAIALSDGKDAVVVDVRAWQYQPDLVSRWLRQNVYDRQVVAHNGQFDLPFLHNSYGCGYPPDVWDTLLAEKLITAGNLNFDGNTLKAVASRRLAVTLDKDNDIRTGFAVDNEWTAEQVAYAENDARVLIPIMQSQSLDIEAASLSTIHDVERRCLPIFAEMERKGIRLDIPQLSKLLRQVEKETAVHEATLQTLLTPHIAWERMRLSDEAVATVEAWQIRLKEAKEGYGMMWDSCREDEEWWGLVHLDYDGKPLGEGKTITPEEVELWREGANTLVPIDSKGRKRYVKRMLYLWRREAGNERPPLHVPTLDEPINLKSTQQMTAAITHYIEETKAKIAPPSDWKAQTTQMWLADAPDNIREEIGTPLVAVRKGYKLLDAFGDRLLSKADADGTLHGRYQQIGTATGRPTCSDPNLLQVPSDAKFRRCFIPREGCFFIVADFSQIELRIMAQFSGDAGFRKAFNEGLDLHKFTASGVFGVPFDDVTDKQRKIAKILNFAILYGVGPMTLRRQIAAGGQQVSMQEAKETLKAWQKTYPQAAALIQHWGDEALAQGYTASAWGRRRNFSHIWQGQPGEREETGIIRRAGANHPIQGTSADITKLSMIFIASRIAEFGGSVIGQVYDEIICEVPKDNVAQAAIVVQESMQEAAGLFITDIPVETDCTISPSWAEEDGIKLSDCL